MEYDTGLEIKTIGSDYFKHAVSILSIFLIFIIFINVSSIPCYASSTINKHVEMIGNITDPECAGCHSDSSSIQAQTLSIQQEKTVITDLAFINTASINNYTAVLSKGQTPYQLGPFFGNGGNGWSWWDSGNFGSEKQKNLISLMILDKSTGKPLNGLTSYPSWPQASYRNHSGTYSYKADITASPITTLVNYPNNIDIWMIKSADLTGYQNASLSFWTRYSMETDFDYGYVAISTDGNTWNYLSGNLTTTTNPYGSNLGNGITGNTNGSWVQETMDLTPYAGNKIFIGFRFRSDADSNDEGWYVDDLNVVSGTTNLFNDDAENQVSIQTLSVNVTYPYLTMINKTDPLTNNTTLLYTTHLKQVDLTEDLSHPGTYLGYFKYDPFAEQYSGNYSVTLDTIINGSQVTANTQFQTTIFGCQGCHNKKLGGVETSFAHGEGGGMQSCMSMCHGGSRGFYSGYSHFGPLLNANPMHVHEMQYGHIGGFLHSYSYLQPNYTVQSHVSTTTCVQCHTSFLHDNTGTDTANIASYILYGTNIRFSSGTHENLTCEFCHGSLAYPAIPQNQYQLQGSLGKYKPSFTSHESFTDTYIINVSGSDNLTITVNGENTAQFIELYTIGPVDNTSTALQGPCGGYPCEISQSLASPINMIIPYPYIGTWILKLTELQEGTINYTISSNYPIERKPIIKIPDCNSCHNSTASSEANTKYEIPDWNPGFAHTDTNNDGNLDIQCRMCHDSMHNISIKDCQTCHTTAPTNHPISEPAFSQYTQVQCLACHGDPHKVTMAGGGCIGCHSKPDTRYYVDTSLFGKHANVNSSDGNNNVTDVDCMTCHFRSSDIIMSPDAGLGAANHSNTWFCDDCHTTGGLGSIKPTNPALMKNGLSHGSTNCQWCHIAGDPLPRPLSPELRYHSNGPRGTAAGKNCVTCHVSSNLPDLPFHAPGEGHSSDIDDCGYCHSQTDNHGVSALNSNTPPLISGLSVTTPIYAGSPVQVQATVTDDLMQTAAAQYQVKKGSTIVKDWSTMTPKDGRFNSVSEVVNASIDTTALLGTYTVNVKGMASAPKTGGGPYYPLNGQWSGVYTTQFIVKQPEGYDNGTVYDSLGAKLAGAIVSTDTGISTTTNSSGFYSLSLVNGTYHLTASKEPEYYPNSSVVVIVTASTTVTQDIILTAKPTGTINGKVTNK